MASPLSRSSHSHSSWDTLVAISFLGMALELPPRNKSRADSHERSRREAPGIHKNSLMPATAAAERLITNNRSLNLFR